MGPLKDVKIIEFAGIGPGPFCGMLLADLGAEVIRIERKDNEGKGDINDIHNRSKKSITADLKNKETIGEVLNCLLYTSQSPRDGLQSRKPSSA